MKEDLDNPFLRKMRTLADVGEDDERYIRRLCQKRETVAAGTELIAQGDRPENVWIILSGLACRYKLLRDGERQIMAFLVPGDICDLHVALLGAMDHTIAINADAEVATISSREVHDILETRPALGRALLMANLIDMAILREWLVNNGRREAYGRVAHLLWELYLRFRAVGLVVDDQFELPITQRELADATSLSHVHVSRTLSRLKDERVIEWRQRTVRVLQPEALREIAGFEPDYLHRSGEATAPVRLSDA